jgi:hypothetical protein
LIPGALLRDTPLSPQREAPARRQEGAPEPDQGRAARWICAACGGEVTNAEAAIDVGGSHVHAFVNPDGVLFRIGCFQRTPGAVAVGAESTYWTWFPGFTWRAAVCRGCLAHLGWAFQGASSSFVALIFDRVIYDEQRGF